MYWKYFAKKSRWRDSKMKLIRIQKPSFARKRPQKYSQSTVRCFRILPFILLFLSVLFFSFYSLSQDPFNSGGELHFHSTSSGTKRNKWADQKGFANQTSLEVTTVQDKHPFKLDPLIDRNATRFEEWSQEFYNTVYKNYAKKYSVSKYADPYHDYPICEAFPVKKLVGFAKVSSVPLNVTEKDVLRRVGLLEFGGSWRPDDCHTENAVGIVIPYRDRLSHLLQLLYYLHPILKRQQLNYKIFVVEQEGNGTFNKGAIMNAAFYTVMVNSLLVGAPKHICFVFHDVDMLPENDHNMYSCHGRPRHLSVAVNEFGYSLPYYELVGGVFSIKVTQFIQVNGYSNLYWGWGGEDDDMGFRLGQVGLRISRPPPNMGRYTMIQHVKRKPLVYKVRSKLVKTSKRRYRYDGLNTLKFKLVEILESNLYTKIIVDIGVPPKEIIEFQQEHEKRLNLTRKI